MSKIQELNKNASCEFKKKLNPDIDLEVDKEYKIIEIKHVKTRFGPSVVVELLEGNVFLPKRLTESMTDECIKDLLSDNGSVLIFKGKKQCGMVQPAFIYSFKKL